VALRAPQQTFLGGWLCRLTRGIDVRLREERIDTRAEKVRVKVRDE